MAPQTSVPTPRPTKASTLCSGAPAGSGADVGRATSPSFVSISMTSPTVSKSGARRCCQQGKATTMVPIREFGFRWGHSKGRAIYKDSTARHINRYIIVLCYNARGAWRPRSDACSLW